jgi:hypothetical protein
MERAIARESSVTVHSSRIHSSNHAAKRGHVDGQ